MKDVLQKTFSNREGTMDSEKKTEHDLGADAAAVEAAEPAASDQLSHAERKCKRVGDVTEHYTAKDGDIHCQCGQVDTTLPVVLFTPAANLNMDEEIEALRAFAAKMQRMSQSGRRAAIFWLADFYLGIKWWGR